MEKIIRFVENWSSQYTASRIAALSELATATVLRLRLYPSAI
jgi:hypothetical protein